MKTVFIAFLFIVGITAFSSCDSCLQCSYTYLNNSSGQDTTVVFGNQCSSKRDLKDYESWVMNQADSLGGVHVCIEQ